MCSLEIFITIVLFVAFPIFFGIWTIIIMLKKDDIKNKFDDLSVISITFWIYYCLILIGYLIYGGIYWW